MQRQIQHCSFSRVWWVWLLGSVHIATFSGFSEGLEVYAWGKTQVWSESNNNSARSVNEQIVSIEQSSLQSKYITFVIEQDWNKQTIYGTGGKCSSGGLDHARHLLAAFLEIARLVMSVHSCP